MGTSQKNHRPSPLSSTRHRKPRGGSTVQSVQFSEPHSHPSLVERVTDFDQQLSQWLHEKCLGPSSYAFLRIFEFSGDGLFWIPAVAALWLAPTKLPPEIRLFLFNLFIGFIFDCLLVGIIKGIVKRPRPVYNRGHLLVVSLDHWSFPSGHSTRAVMIATFFWLYLAMWKNHSSQISMLPLKNLFKDCHPIIDDLLPAIEDWLVIMVAITITTWAVATMASRIILGRHFFLDVVAGLVIGFLESLLAHFVLYVPGEISELPHKWIYSRFGFLQDTFWNFFFDGRFSS